MARQRAGVAHGDTARRTKQIRSDYSLGLGWQSAPPNCAACPGDFGARPPLHQRVKDQVRALEHDAIVTALKDAMGNKAKAARLLRIDYKTFHTS